MLKEIIFTNSYEEYDEPIITKIKVEGDEAIKSILAWYGAYYSGDPYTVSVNGQLIDLDLNGNKNETLIDGDYVEAADWHDMHEIPYGKD